MWMYGKPKTIDYECMNPWLNMDIHDSAMDIHISIMDCLQFKIHILH